MAYLNDRVTFCLSRTTAQDRFRIVLVRTRNPLNLGAAARAMSNFGFLHLRVVKPYETAFREARSAVGGASVLAQAEQFPSVAAAISDCSFVLGTTAIRHRKPEQRLVLLPDVARCVRPHLREGRIALLFGNEKTGLSNDDLSHCHGILHIPTRENHLSMNLGQSVAVCLYQLSRYLAPQGRAGRDASAAHTSGKARASSANSKPSSNADVERLTQSLLEVLRLSGYIKAGADASTERNLRTMLRRHQLSAPDAQAWLGILRQILWKLSAPD
jgi:tRNA/rRNA methyltransferase